MFKKLKTLIVIGLTGSFLLAPIATPVFASAISCSGNAITSGVETGVQTATNGTSTCDTNGSGAGVTSGIESVAKTAINIFSIIVGVVAVLMIVYGGFRYISSGGDSGKVGNAKNTLIYAIVGLVIVALAQLIVHYVLNEANNISTNTTSSIYLVEPKL